jgi:hypothetical protein
MIDPASSIQRVQMAAIGATLSLPRVPAKVS